MRNILIIAIGLLVSATSFAQKPFNGLKLTTITPSDSGIVIQTDFKDWKAIHVLSLVLNTSNNIEKCILKMADDSIMGLIVNDTTVTFVKYLSVTEANDDIRFYSAPSLHAYNFKSNNARVVKEGFCFSLMRGLRLFYPVEGPITLEPSIDECVPCGGSTIGQAIRNCAIEMSKGCGGGSRRPVSESCSYSENGPGYYAECTFTCQ